MRTHRIILIASLLVSFFAQSAQAFFDPPWITPVTPLPGETVSVNIRAIEFPMAGIALSDPCMGGAIGARNCVADVIFRNGFQFP